MASSSNNNVNNEAVANNSSSLSQEVARDNRRVLYLNAPQAGGGPITRQRAKSTRTHRSPYLRPNTSTSCVSAVRGSNVQPVCGSEIICNRKARTELVKFVWNIDNFSFYKDSRGQDLDIIESPPFQNNEGTYNWRLRFIIHPRPQRESDVACKDYVQVFVQLDSGPTPTVPVWFN